MEFQYLHIMLFVLSFQNFRDI